LDESSVHQRELMFFFLLQKLKDILVKVTSEKSQLATDMELLKVQEERLKAEYLTQIRSLEVCTVPTIPDLISKFNFGVHYRTLYYEIDLIGQVD